MRFTFFLLLTFFFFGCESNDVEFVNISDSKCKKKTTLGGYHGLALTKCYADEEKKEKDLVNYLGKLF